LDKRSNKIKCWGTKLKKKINQENDKNIEIERMRTKNRLKKTNAIKLEWIELQKNNNKEKYKTQKYSNQK